MGTEVQYESPPAPRSGADDPNHFLLPALPFAMDLSQFFNVVQLANALALASLLTILASGLALIFGLRDVMNFAHGALYMLGAFLGYTVARLFNFWVALLIVPIVLAVVGVVFEYAVLRHCNGARTWTWRWSPLAWRSFSGPR